MNFKVLYFFIFINFSFAQNFDTLNFSNYPTKINWKVKKEEIKIENNTIKQIDFDSVITTEIQGFRIQLIETNNFEELQEAKIKLLNLENIEFFVVFDSPIYKLRVGNFKTRKESTGKLEYFKQNGFENAWVVPDRIKINSD